MKLFHFLLVLLGLCRACLTVDDRKRSQVTNFIAFGDSYTDTCNTWRMNASPEMQAAYPYPSCPPPPDGKRARSWTNYLSRVGQVHTLAFSAATCSNAAFPRPVKDLGEQIELLRTNFNTTEPIDDLSRWYDPETTVCALYIGLNDHTYFLADLDETAASVKINRPRYADFLAIPECVISHIDQLHSLGMRRFLLMEHVPLSEFPKFNIAAGPKTYVETAVLANNKIQELMSRLLVAEWGDGSTIEIFPTYQLFEEFFTYPDRFLFNTDEEFSPTSILANDLHPSDLANQYLASKIERFILEGARGRNLIDGTT